MSIWKHVLVQHVITDNDVRVPLILFYVFLIGLPLWLAYNVDPYVPWVSIGFSGYFLYLHKKLSNAKKALDKIIPDVPEEKWDEYRFGLFAHSIGLQWVGPNYDKPILVNVSERRANDPNRYYPLP